MTLERDKMTKLFEYKGYEVIAQGANHDPKTQNDQIENMVTYGAKVILIALVTGFKYTDMGPFRAIKTQKLKELQMTDKNYGWNVEMQIKAVKKGFKIKEVPVDYRNRMGTSKISGTISGVIKAGTKIIYSVFKYAGK